MRNANDRGVADNSWPEQLQSRSRLFAHLLILISKQQLDGRYYYFRFGPQPAKPFRSLAPN